jgi:hypothetical protein
MLFFIGWLCLVVSLCVWTAVWFALRVRSVDVWLDPREGYVVSKKIYDYEKEKGDAGTTV